MIKEIIRKIKHQEEKPTTHVAYTPEERASLERSCEGILKQEVFGRRDFEAFNMAMFQLTAKAGDRLPLNYVILYDKKAKDHAAIEIKPHEITVHSGSVLTDVANYHCERLNQRIRYESQGEQNVNRRAKVEDSQPILYTIVSGDTQHIPYSSYFSGEEETVVAMPQRSLSKQVSDKDVQAFCAKVYSLYTDTKNNS